MQTLSPTRPFLWLTGTVAVLVLWLSGFVSWHTGIAHLQAQSAQRLDRFASHLSGQLARYDFIPRLLAGNPQIKELLLDPDNPARVDVMNHYLEDVNAVTGAADTYVMNGQGRTLAASNWQAERPFVGSNFGFRPYFRQAMQGGSGRYYALGTTSGIRGYYFAYPVRHVAEVIGVVVLKMDLVDIEARWADLDARFIVTDQDGVIFISTEPTWRFLSIQRLGLSDLDRIRQSRRYPGVPLATLQLTPTETLHDGARLLRVNRQQASGPTHYLSISHAMPDAGWDVHILSPTRAVRDGVINHLMLTLLSMLLFGALLSLYVQRRRRRLERERFEARAKRELALRVIERTAELTHEIEEHERTEQELRATRDELVQAAKLAVLGQLSASISHELNNPLAAIRSYADNARQFLQRAQTTAADNNLERIVSLTDRMARISSQLKVFARKSRGQLESAAIVKLVREALEIVRSQARQAGVELNCQCLDEQLTVRADPVQLVQVLVNLLTNGLHAAQNRNPATVTLRTEQLAGEVLVHVEDTGAGIDPENIDQIFEPFFTTREAGLGLGLSISRQIIESMNGRIEVCNRPTGGARFSIRLPRENA